MSYDTYEKRFTPSSDTGLVVVLTDGDGQNYAEIAPALGFNCVRWQSAHAGKTIELLYADPKVFAGARPTRSGIPVLFPFPNRIRAGQFAWAGQQYQLPLNDPTSANAIHGWACRYPWRVLEREAHGHRAWVVGEFQASRDARGARLYWPADYILRLRYELRHRILRLEATVENPDRVPLPFGLGFHPYVRVPLLARSDAAAVQVEAPVTALWQLRDSLPTGQLVPLDAAHDLRQARSYGDLHLDDLYQVQDLPAESDGLVSRGQVAQAGESLAVRLRTSPAFRHLVAFTPPHRQAMCLEPYTCITDAVNLQQQGVDAGLLVLQPGERWTGVVEFLC
ncbi:MAG TPA: aldose 1-epimerase [Gemmataceae bacterium]|nr:aldose 1-epimerase [Gemmataceae bacterium]